MMLPAEVTRHKGQPQNAVRGRYTIVILSLLLAAATVLCAGGCLFNPRDPDGPPDGGETDWETPVTTTIVRANLKAAMEGENNANYEDCFTDDFRFHVDPSDSLDAGQEGEERYADWVKDDEILAVAGIFAGASEIQLRFVTTVSPDETQDETFRREEYVLTVFWSSGQHVNEEIIYKGIATLHLRRTQSRWAIYKWVDRRIVEPDENETWGVLRGDYRQ
ncbi:hypothetical protein K8S17_03635 [bacterium]|nr:hypothetical protein [bacterium]